MGTADELLNQIFSWIKERELLADQLRELAKELESLREKCNVSDTIGSTMSVAGAACMIGGGIATFFTGGAAAPLLLAEFGAIYGGVGAATSLITKITEHFLSSATLKKAVELETKSNDTAKNIKKLFEKLKTEIQGTTSFANTDELEGNILTNILKAITKREEIHVNVDKRFYLDTEWTDVSIDMALNKTDKLLLFSTLGVMGILMFFGCCLNGKKWKYILSEKGLQHILSIISSVADGLCNAAKGLIKSLQKTISTTGFKAGCMVLGGAVGVAFALPEAIKNWKDLIKNNHVTEASQSVRDTANEIQKTTRMLRKTFDNIKTMLQEKAEEEKLLRKIKAGVVWASGAQDGGSFTLLLWCLIGIVGLVSVCVCLWDLSPSSVPLPWELLEMRAQYQLKASQAIHQAVQSKDEVKEKPNQPDDNDSGCGDDSSSIPSESSGTTASSDISSSESSSESSDEVEESDQDVPVMRGAALNARSVYGEATALLRDIHEERHLDYFGLGELFPDISNINKILKEIAPDSKIYHGGRVHRRRGIAELVSKQFRSKFICSRFTRFVEYQVIEIQHDKWPKAIKVINIYRPPGFTNRVFEPFLLEMKKLMKKFHRNDSILITGDFNIWYDYEFHRCTRDFQKFLDNNHLEQYVRKPTHESGHTLDLLIARNIEIDFNVQNDMVSDHFTIYFTAKPE